MTTQGNDGNGETALIVGGGPGIAETYLQLHRQHRATWAFEVVLRPWVENW